MTLEFEKPKNDRERKLQDELAQFDERIKLLEMNARKAVYHVHNGLDMGRVRFKDLEKILYKEFTFNPGSLADGVGETKSVTVSGAQLGDFVLASAPYDLQDITVTAYVQAADTVEVRLQNESTNTVDLASGTWRVLVIKKLL